MEKINGLDRSRYKDIISGFYKLKINHFFSDINCTKSKVENEAMLEYRE